VFFSWDYGNLSVSSIWYKNTSLASKNIAHRIKASPNHTSAIVSGEVAVVYAMKIQKWIKHRDATRMHAAESLKNTFHDQNYRLSLL
jgi:hypothetical protein